MDEPEKILIRCPNPIGDLIMATPSFIDIRKQYPGARITMLVRAAQAKVLLGSNYFDDIIFDESSKGLSHLIKLVGNLRNKNFDMCLLFTNSIRTAFVVVLAGIKKRIGFAKGGQSIFLTQAIQPILNDSKKWQAMPMPEIYSRLCKEAGIKNTQDWPQLAVSIECENKYADLRVELGIGENEKLIGLAPGASFGQSKLWPAKHLANLADSLTEKYSLRTIILSGPGEESFTSELTSSMKTKPIIPKNLIDLDLLKPVIRDLALLVATDSGPRHFGTAFKVPTVVVMGPTDPRWSDCNLDSQEVVRHDVSCGPCHKKVCPEDHRCMIGITPDEVMCRIDQLDKRVSVFT